MKDRAHVEGQGITGAKVEQSIFYFCLRAPRSADLMRCTARKSVVDEGAPDSPVVCLMPIQRYGRYNGLDPIAVQKRKGMQYGNSSKGPQSGGAHWHKR